MACENHSGTMAEINNLKTQMERFDQHDVEMAKGLSEIREQLIEVLQSVKSAHHRLDNADKQADAVMRMSISVEKLAGQVEQMLTLLQNHDERLDIIERKPGSVAIKAWLLIATCALTAIAGYLVGKL